MKFDPKTFKLALWNNKQRNSDKAPTHRGTATFGNLRVPVVCWLDEEPENNRPNISIQLERGYVMPSDKEDLQGENAVDWNLIETDRTKKLDELETLLESKLDLLEFVEQMKAAQEEAA